MNWLVGITNRENGAAITGYMEAPDDRGAVLRMARFAGLSPEGWLRVRNADDSWAVKLYEEGFWFALAAPN